MMAEARTRLAPVDGLRGLAAGMIVIGHVHQWAGTPELGALSAVLTNMGIGVQLFFVLSGFCLFYPLTKPGAVPDWRRFFVRRARRILPPYYATIAALILLPFLLTPVARDVGMVAPADPAWPAWRQVWTHLLFLHTLSPVTMFGLDGPFWSLGVEMQFYLVFPVAVWLVARYGWRAGLGSIAAITILYRLAIYVSAHAQQSTALLAAGNGTLEVKVDFFTGCWLQFGLGMAVALAARGGRLAPLARRWEGALLPLALALLVGGLAHQHSAPDRWLLPIGDTLIVAAWALVLLTACSAGTLTSKVFGLRPLVGLGTISYSLYLVHDPILIGLAPSALALHLGGAGSTLVLGAVGVPIALVCAWASYRLFERPFLREARAEQVSRGRAGDMADAGTLPAPMVLVGERMGGDLIRG